MKTRVMRTSASVLTHRFEVGETATDSTTAVTVTVTDPSGATVASGTATHGATGTYTYALPPQAALTVLAVAWSATIGGAAVVETDTVEVVGGFMFTLSEGRNSDASLADRDKYPTADLDAKRLEVEEECERICDRSFVPRYARVTVDGSGSADLVLPHPDPDRTAAHVRTIRSVSMAQRSGGVPVAFTSAELAALVVRGDSLVSRSDGLFWAEGYGNVVVEYEYGLDGPALELKRAAMGRLRSLLNANKTGIPDRASSFTAGDGGTYRLDMPGAWKTGLPAVDAVYARYSRRSGAGAAGGRPIPASRTLDYDPQRNSLMHGGPR
ncbi:hypothetical protein GCM10023196_035590 [Actinoallomurus vinaceus]|uniref:Big-1 domain-containing protein n=1 Tax=Actinoallomurus vinaceus TaxID=1080074 RepID=A0ABP8UAN4_9ACTN